MGALLSIVLDRRDYVAALGDKPPPPPPPDPASESGSPAH
jgi:hypothetical protein